MTRTDIVTVPAAWISKDDTIIHGDGILIIEHIGPHPCREDWLQVLGTHISLRGVLVGHDHDTSSDTLIELIWASTGSIVTT